MPFNINSIKISGKELYPIIEGGKGIGVTNGFTAGSFAAAGAVGTFSGVNGDRYDEDGNLIPITYTGKTRKDRHFELIEMGIEASVCQAKIARDVSGGKGVVHMNVLWEMGGAQQVLEGALEKANGLIDGITCGAGMPYKLAEIASKYDVYYYPIVSSMRAFRLLWKRSFSKLHQKLGGVVYEDPWRAGGHNGLSNNEDPLTMQDPYPRVVELRKFMNEVGLSEVPIIMAGGVWHLKDYSDWLNNPDIGLIAFQFGTRPILTIENPVSDEWKRKLLQLKKGDVFLNRFSPTGFYSSAVKNDFIQELDARNKRQLEYNSAADEIFSSEFEFGRRGRKIYLKPQDTEKAKRWINEGYEELLKTPDNTIIFVSKAKAAEIREDQINCMGCLSQCKFSNWKDSGEYSTGLKADPRSFCIQKTLQDIAHGGSINDNLMFSGHNAYKFAEDPFYANNFIPTTKQLVDRILTGE